MLESLLQALLLASLYALAMAAKWELPFGRAMAGGLIAAPFAALAGSWVPEQRVLLAFAVQSVASVTVLLGAIAFFFFRDPERVPPEEDGVVLSPADGRVIYVKSLPSGSLPESRKGRLTYPIEELAGRRILDRGGFLVGIAMNFLDVHVNRTPVRGRVSLSRHVSGKFLSLRLPEAIRENTRHTTLIEGFLSGGASLPVAVIQISSRLVRRIQSFVRPGDQVEMGQRMGVITFGSQVDVVLPRQRGMRVLVRPGQVLRAGESIIARFEGPGA